eukprot:scaffold12085_cov54-Phaeocystis_antarctica.AAC.5
MGAHGHGAMSLADCGGSLADCPSSCQWGKNTAVVEPCSGILARGGRERKGRNYAANGLFFF